MIYRSFYAFIMPPKYNLGPNMWITTKLRLNHRISQSEHVSLFYNYKSGGFYGQLFGIVLIISKGMSQIDNEY